MPFSGYYLYFMAKSYQINSILIQSDICSKGLLLSLLGVLVSELLKYAPQQTCLTQGCLHQVAAPWGYCHQTSKMFRLQCLKVRTTCDVVQLPIDTVWLIGQQFSTVVILHKRIESTKSSDVTLRVPIFNYYELNQVRLQAISLNQILLNYFMEILLNG